MAKTPKKTLGVLTTAKNKFFSIPVIKDFIEFHKVKDMCTIVLFLMEAGLVWSILSFLMG
tara:strand:- start:970 stop:1149 length:180 start_codon:yes stop_codon:yes gene_type:complete